MRIYGILLKVKRPSFNPLKDVGPGLLPVDRTVDRDRSRSTGPVDRCAQMCTVCLAGGPVDRPGRLPENTALWIWPRSTGRSTGRELLLSISRPRSTGRSTGGTTIGNPTVGGRPAGRPKQGILLSWTPTAIFFRPINWGCFLQDFWKVFKLVFPTSLSIYIHLF